MTYNSNKTSYELAIVELHANDDPQGKYSVILTIQKTLSAMPMTVVDDTPVVMLWDTRKDVKALVMETRQQILLTTANPKGNIKGYVAEYKDGRRKKFIGYVVMSAGTDTPVRWATIDPESKVANCFVECGRSKSAQAHAAELMDSLSAYNIDWTKMPISEAELG